ASSGGFALMRFTPVEVACDVAFDAQAMAARPHQFGCAQHDVVAQRPRARAGDETESRDTLDAVDRDEERHHLAAVHGTAERPPAAAGTTGQCVEVTVDARAR